MYSSLTPVEIVIFYVNEIMTTASIHIENIMRAQIIHPAMEMKPGNNRRVPHYLYLGVIHPAPCLTRHIVGNCSIPFLLFLYHSNP